jgi:hypothetical protein
LERHLARCRVEKEEATKALVAAERKFAKERKDVRLRARAAFKKDQVSYLLMF